mgnify:CR=1 FL=1
MMFFFQNLPAKTHASFLMILALFMFTVMGICIRLSTASLPVIEVVFFRNFLATLILLPFITRAGFETLRMQKPRLFFLRAFVGTIGMFCGFTALTLIPLAEVTALSFTTPLFVTIGAVVFLGEIIKARRIIAICIGFMGTMIILQPGILDLSIGSILAIINALTIAMISIIVKLQTRTETQQAIVSWMVLLQIPLCLIPALWVWQWPDSQTWAFLWGLALAGTIAHICFTRACSLVDITALQPLEFIKLPFAVALAWIIFSEWPSLWTWIGGSIVFASTLYITHREMVAHEPQKPKARP